MGTEPWLWGVRHSFICIWEGKVDKKDKSPKTPHWVCPECTHPAGAGQAGREERRKSETGANSKDTHRSDWVTLSFHSPSISVVLT